MKKKLAILLIIIVLIIGGFLLYKKPTYHEQELNMGYTLDENSKEDTDGDGISNKQEKEYQTSPVLIDTDLDGLDDLFEIEQTKTSPIKKDTDDDGLTDYDEILLKLDPLKKDTYNDGINDNKRENNYEIQTDDVLINITGTGNIANTYISVNYDTELTKQEGALNKEISFYSLGNIKEMTATFTLTDEELQSLNISPYEWNEVVVAQINKENYQDYKLLFNADYDYEKRTISFPIKDYQKYSFVIGDAKILDYQEQREKSEAKNGWKLIANSNFDINKHAFSFRNYVTNYSLNGNCYGMALFTSLYYSRALPMESGPKKYKKTLQEGLSEKVFGGFKDYGYSFKNTYFENYHNLKDFKIKTTKRIINIDELQNDKAIDNSEKQLFNAINQLQGMQNIIKLQYTGGFANESATTIIKNTYNCHNRTYLTCHDFAQNSISTLQKRMSLKQAPMIVLGGFTHGVNAIRLYQREKEANKYKIVLYDNNDPEDEKAIEVECSYSSCVIVNNSVNGTFAFASSLTDEMSGFLNE